MRARRSGAVVENFYSRPCGRGDVRLVCLSGFTLLFLLTPLREGRLASIVVMLFDGSISTHAPAGGATPPIHFHKRIFYCNFYSRPCGRGDQCSCSSNHSSN